VKYAWIARHKKDWPVALTCEVLDVSVSGYFEHRLSMTKNLNGASWVFWSSTMLLEG
jgi:hypothetical protein